MNALTLLSPTATHMIRADHMAVLADFHKLTPDTSPRLREAAVRRLCQALEVHTRLEEECFYPLLREAGVQSPVLDRSEAEHRRVRDLMASVQPLSGQPDEQLRAVDELMNEVLHHVADEESQLLPAAERTIERERLCEIGERTARRKLELSRPPGGAVGAAAGTAPASGTRSTLDRMRARPVRAAAWAAVAALAALWLVEQHRRRRFLMPV